ncbi:ras-related protein Rab-7L1 [Larimichthys crocea]|uniref:ras-related protein Rab-7L1 n=1 Tax=Larimichthys crocea TaxID=215358 RepID=UPI000F5F2AEA|nr:ras-related protein Rab-7L1 [Larimichthys crocea]
MLSLLVWQRRAMTEHLLKILVVGDGNVGKTSFVRRYVNGQFNSSYKMTVGVDFSVKVLHWSDKEKVRLQLWDIAGQERFISMTRIYYKGALGCVVMFDVTSSASFLSCRRWKQDLDNKAMLPNGDSIPCILLANKCDLAERVVSAESIGRFSEANGFITWMEISVKDNKNVGEAMRRLVEGIFLIQSGQDTFHPRSKGSIHPEADSSQCNSRVGCGC